MPYLKSSDISKQIDWYIRKKTDITLTLTFTATGAYDLSSYTISSTVRNLSGTTMLTPSLVNGGATGIITLSITDTQSNIPQDEYFWSLSITDPDQYMLINGRFIVNDFTWDSEQTNSTNSVIVDIGGTNVTISASTT